jgi:hypothetical protein
MFILSGWALGLLPVAIILQHAMFLYLYRTRLSSGDFKLRSGMQFLAPALKSARQSEAKEFGLPMLALRYGVPGVMIAILDITWFYVLSAMPEPIAPYAAPMRLGALGAYFYVLLNLGQRNFRRDITSAVAVWCAVTLAVGPVLAGVLNYLAISGTTQPKQDTFTLATATVYFLAGLAPRYVASAIEEAARRLLSTSGATVVAPRTVSLTKIRGIAPDIETRLGEEGIVDVYGLAMANPNRILRNTSFDPRQIVAWIDEALLIYNVPFWEALEADGITGAIDLAWYYNSDEDDDADQPPKQPPPAPQAILHRVAVPLAEQPPHLVPTGAALPSQPPPAPQQATARPPQRVGATQQDQAPVPQTHPQIPAAIVALAARIQVDAPRLSDCIERVYQDAQVQQVWVLYQTDSNELHPMGND